MATTADLGIPLVSGQQAQPEITHNEALVMLHALANGVISMALNTPPGSPADGDSYVVGPAPTGAWAGRANSVVVRMQGAWRFVPDRNSAGTVITMGARQEGLRVWDKATNGLYVWSGSAWTAIASTPPLPTEYGQRSAVGNTTALSLAAAADSTLASDGDYTQVTGIFVEPPDGENYGVTQQANSFTINRAGVYRIEFWASARSNQSNTQVAFRFAVNGTLGTQRRPKIFMRGSGEVHCGSAFGYRHFDAGDVVTLWVASTNTTDVVIEDCVFGAASIKFD